MRCRCSSPGGHACLYIYRIGVYCGKRWQLVLDQIYNSLQYVYIFRPSYIYIPGGSLPMQNDSMGAYLSFESLLSTEEVVYLQLSFLGHE